MLIIRPEQMAALAEALCARFDDELVAMLQRDGAPALDPLPEGDRRAAIREARREAQRQGLVSKDDVRTFVRCTGHHGPRFYRDQAWAAEILANPSLAPADKLLRITAGRI